MFDFQLKEVRMMERETEGRNCTSAGRTKTQIDRQYGKAIVFFHQIIFHAINGCFVCFPVACRNDFRGHFQQNILILPVELNRIHITLKDGCN